MLMGSQLRFPDAACLLVNLSIIMLRLRTVHGRNWILAGLLRCTPRTSSNCWGDGLYSVIACERIYRKDLGDEEPTFPQTGAMELITL